MDSKETQAVPMKESDHLYAFYVLFITEIQHMISKLPEEWSPGPSCMGLPWLPVVTTVCLGCITTLCFIWKNILIVRPTEYLVGEKDIQKHLDEATKEKTAVLAKIEELKTQSEALRNQQQMSKESAEMAMERVKQLEIALKEVESRNELLVEECDSIMRTFDDERAKYLAHVDKSANYEKSLSKLQRSMKKTQDALAKSKALMDESKIREDARTSLHQSLQREHATLKEENNSLKNKAKQLEDKNHQLCDQIKVFIKSQKEYEDTIAQKDHSNEVLTELLVDLEAYDLQKSDSKAVANGEASSVSDRASSVKRRIKQLMDVSQVQTTLSVVAEERNRFQNKLLSEERDRKALEEKYRELEHNSTSLKSEKSLIENQLKILQQKYEIMTEMYQQKELSLQRRLTDEELERRDKELKLSEVDGKALEAEQEVKIYRQRIKEMEEEVKKTEKALKVQIAEQERKAHENWVAANTAERSLSQEKTLRRNLRERLAALSNQLNDLRAANSAHPAVHCGDSYGPSPVSGGAPSPPLMIEGPGRPLSAPIGRRIDPYGHRPPFEKHPVPNRPDPGPRTSSPTNMDDSTDPTQSETLETGSEVSPECSEASSRSQGPGSFLESPIRDPGPMPHGLPPPGPRLPPPFAHGYRPPPPSHLPPGIRQANGIEGMAGAEFRYRGPPNRHPGMMGPRLGPPPLGPALGPPPMRLPSNMPHHPGPAFGGGPPPGPFPPYHQDMRFPGPWDYGGPPQHLPPPQDPGAPQPSGGQDSGSRHAADPVRSAMSEP